MIVIVTFVIDDNALEILKKWADDNIDLVIRFCDDISPMFTKARILYYHNDDKPVEMRYSVNLDKKVFALIPFTDRPSVRFTIRSVYTPVYLLMIACSFELIGSFYQRLGLIFAYINSFVLNAPISSAAKKAMSKKTLLDFKKDTFFTVRRENFTAYLDVCKVEVKGDKFIYKS